MVHGGGSGGGGGGDWWHLTRISSISAPLSLSRKPLFHITTDNGVMGLDLKTKSYNSRFHNYHFDSGGLGRYSLGLILVPMIGLGWIFDKTTVSLGLGSSCGFGFGLRGRINSVWVWVV